MADGSIIIEVKGDADELEKALRKVSKSADTLEDAVKDVASAFKKVENAADDVDGDGLKDAAKDADRLDDKLDDAADSAGRLGDKLGDGFTVAKGALANLAAEGIQMVASGLVDLGGEAINAADSLVRFSSMMEFAGFGVDRIEAAKSALSEYASSTSYDLETVLNTAAQLGANGVQNFEELTIAAGNLNAVASGNADTFKSVAMVLTQTAGAGKLTTENWNQLADAIPGASGVLQEAMKKNGAYTGDFRDAMAAGEITADEFAQAILQLGMTDVAQEAASSTETISGAFDNLKATVVDGFVAALTDGGLYTAITGFLNGLTAIVTQASAFLPVISGVAVAVGAFAIAINIGPILTAVGSAVGVVTGGFAALNAVLLANPITAVVALLAGLAAAFVTAYKTSEEFRAKVDGAFKAIKDAGATVVQAFVGFFKEDIPKTLQAAADKVEETKKKISEAFENIKKACSEKIEAARKTIEKAAESIRKFLSLEGLSTTVDGVFEAIKTAITTRIELAQGVVSTAAGAIGNLLGFSGLSTTVGGVFESIKTGITDKINAARDAVQRAIDRIKSFFNFSWSLPHLKLPRISISGGFSLNPPSVPKFSLSWFAKGGVMTDPTIFGRAGNTLLAGGEAGPEAIAPISVLQDYIKESVTDGMGDFVQRLKSTVEDSVEAFSRKLGERGEMVVPGGHNETVYNLEIVQHIDAGGIGSPQKARDIGRELGQELGREMRRRGLAPA